MTLNPALSQAGSIRRLMDAGTLTARSDADLLERFAGLRDEAAFEALVARHGSMVLWVCRSVLRDTHDAEDAFQATFLVLARKASSLWVKESLASWLYRVAVRVAAAARKDGRVRRNRERLAAEHRLAGMSPDPGRDMDLLALVCEEIDRLPAKYREPVILCHLEEMTHEAAARALRCPIGTVHGRLSRARELLRQRLSRRGLAGLSALSASGLLESHSVAASVPPALGHSTVRAAIETLAGNMTHAGLVSATAAVDGRRGPADQLHESHEEARAARPVRLAHDRHRAGRGCRAEGEGARARTRRSLGASPLARLRSRTKKRSRERGSITAIDQVQYQPSEEERAFWKTGKLTMTIDATRIIFDSDKSSWSYTLDPTRSPKRMMLKTDAGKPATAIYKLEGDDLKIFVGRGLEEDEAPPADFSIKSARPGTFPTLFVLRRKPKETESPKPAKEGEKAAGLQGDARLLQGTWKLVRVEEARAEQKTGGLAIGNRAPRQSHDDWRWADRAHSLEDRG